MVISWYVIITVICFLFSMYHIAGALDEHRKNKDKKIRYDIEKQGISILIPCYNEYDVLNSTIQNIKNLLQIYPNSEYIFINDGSTDNTLQELIKELNLIKLNRPLKRKLEYAHVKEMYESIDIPNVYVIDKLNGGKADSLNAGIEFSSNDIVITLDADTILEKDSLDAINSEFQDKNLIAAGGMVNILQSGQLQNNKLNFKKKFLIRFQILEYIKSFVVIRSSLSRINALYIISGAFGIFRKNVLYEIGGYRKTVGEDIDITMKVQEYIDINKEKRMAFLPLATCHTECPVRWRDLYNQRIRWQKAFMDCLIRYFFKNIKTVFSKRVSMFFLIEGFVIGIIATVFTLQYLIFVSTFGYHDATTTILLIYVVSYVLINLTNTIAALKLSQKFGFKFDKKTRFHLICAIIGDLVFFRLVYMFFILTGTVSYFFKKDGWEKINRTGENYLKKSV